MNSIIQMLLTFAGVFLNTTCLPYGNLLFRGNISDIIHILTLLITDEIVEFIE